MKNTRFRRNNKKRLFFLICGVLILVASVIAYRYISLNLWITQDAGLLQPYPRALIQNEIRITAPPLTPDRDIAQIEEAIINANSRDRIVLNLSRSDVRYNLFRTRSYVKVFLRTAIPNDRSRSTSIKFLNILHKKKDGWRSYKTQDISLE